MKNKGFTLMELLGVIMILAILALITFPPIIEEIKKSKSEIKGTTKVLIIDAAKDYYEDNINNYELIEGVTYCININTLSEQGYLNKKIKDENLNDINTSKNVKLVYHNAKFDYDVVDTCNSSSLTRNNIEVPIVTEDSGLYKSQTDEGRYIYRGGDPINNWIELNEGTEQTPNYIKYRIISFENDGTIKVVRDTSIGTYAFDTVDNRNQEIDTFCTFATTYGCNIWGNQNNMLFKGNILEGDFYGYYYVSSISTTLKQYGSGTITKDASLNTFLNPINAEQETKWEKALNLDKYIQIHSFDTGGVYYVSSSTSDKGLPKEKEETKLFTWNGKITIPSITDFVESSNNTNCTSVWSNFYNNPNHNGWPCNDTNYNWLYKTGGEWTLTLRQNTTANLWITTSDGFKNSGTPKNKYAVRPAFYLKSSLSLTGEGSETNPYRIVGES